MTANKISWRVRPVGGILIRLQGIYQTSLPLHASQSTQTAVAGPRPQSWAISASYTTAHNESSTTRPYRDARRSRGSTQTLEPCSSASRLHARIHVSSGIQAKPFVRRENLYAIFTPLRTEAAPAAAVKACHRARPGLALVNHARAARGVGKACNGSPSVSAHAPGILDISICAST
jgi:hypothetical protein